MLFRSNSFSSAATLATQNAQLTAASTRIQETQTARQLFQTEGTQLADVAGAGFTESGSALDLLKSSMSQGALAKSLVNIQGAIQENSYAAQAGAYQGEAAAANEASTAGTISAIGAIGGALINGSGALVSAGKTVVQGYNYITGLFTGGADAGAAFTGAAATTAAENTSSFLAPGAVDNSLLSPSDSNLMFSPNSPLFSATDTSVSTGADLSSNLADTSVGIDTSGLGIGDSLSSVTDAIGNAFSSIGDSIASTATDLLGSGVTDAIGAGLSDLIPGLGFVSMLGMIPGVDNIPVIGDVVSGISDAVNAVVSPVVNVVSDIGSAIGGLFGSVICTALYKRGMLTRQVWHGAQTYGRDVAPDNVYLAYIMWGSPIARAITKSELFAKIVAPIFIPWAHELAVLAGEKTAKSTLFGRTVFRVTYAFSWVMGKVIKQRGSYATA